METCFVDWQGTYYLSTILGLWSFIPYIKHEKLNIEKIGIQGILAFRDFTICDPLYFVILFQASFHNFEENNKSKIKKNKPESFQPSKASQTFQYFKE